MLRRLKVIGRSDFLNQSDSRSICPVASSKARTGVSPGNKGKPQADSIKDKKRKPKPIAICPQCGKHGGVSAMHRHHFNNCGLGIAEKTLTKIKNTNHQKGARPVVEKLRNLKKLVPREQARHLDMVANIKEGWYQLPDEVIQNAVNIYAVHLS